MSVLLTLLVLFGQEAVPADLPAGAGPRATSQSFGAARYDAVGYASWYGEEVKGKTASGQIFDPKAITAAHKTLPMGSFVEVTALDTGRTILVVITDRGPHVPGRIIDLSRGAAELLGITKQAVAAVRVRLAEPPAADQIALRNGRAASPRLDATPQLVAALRKQLPVPKEAPPPAPPPPSTPAPVAPAQSASTVTPHREPRKPQPAKPAPTSTSTPVRALFVQVGTFSSMPRAKALATSLRGSVQPSGALFRVRIGPFANRAAAGSARDDVARRGYGDARIVQE